MTSLAYSASLVIGLRRANLARFNPKNGSNSDIAFCLVQRSSRMQAFPSMRTFPGGKCAREDFQQQLFPATSSESNLSGELLAKLRQDMDLGADLTDGQLELGLKVTALRETFEETGHLLHEPPGKKQCHSVAFPAEHELVKRVGREPGEFAEGYRLLGLHMPINSLACWSNWTTPLGFKRRFNTTFFAVPVDLVRLFDKDAPNFTKLADDTGEIDECIYADAHCYLQERRVLAPPQIYELQRLLNYPTYDELAALFRDLRKPTSSSVQEWLNFVATEEGSDNVKWHILPGDSLYPKVSSGSSVVSEAEIQSSSLGINRMRMEKGQTTDNLGWESNLEFNGIRRPIHI